MNNREKPSHNSSEKNIDVVRKSLGKRYRAERRFRMYGITAIYLSLGFLMLLFGSIIGNGYSAFMQTYVKLNVFFDPDYLDVNDLETSDYAGLVKKTLRSDFPYVNSRGEKRQLYSLISTGAGFQLRDMVLENPDILGTTRSVWMPADDDVDMLMKGHLTREGDESSRRLKDNQLNWIDKWIEQGRVKKQFNTVFLSAGDSREPELAGIWGAVMGSIFTLVVTLILSFPMGVAAAVYLEEFAPQNKWSDFLEVNINNLAAVPSIVFGLLGLAVFLNFMHLPRSAPVVGGLVLSLMTLPTIIIASRATLKSVPPSIREAALGVGASKMQTIVHHVLPLALPGILTGTIIGMARALGETAPLLMIGMVAFIVDIPGSFMDPSTVLPVQVYLWADSPERAFVERTSAAIMILLAFLIFMNAAAVILRSKFERRW
jgi:phosphate transport system permease protein